LSDENVERRVRIFVRSPREWTGAGARELEVVQTITPDDRVPHKEFAVTMREKLDGNNKFLRKIMFSKEATFHVPKPDDRVPRKEFAVTMREKLYGNNKFLRKIMFSEEATFHVP
jgi:hypothetical protein